MTAADAPLRLRELLAACVSAGTLAGLVIRDVVRQGGDLEMVNKADDKYDPQTVADRRSQQRIVHALRHVWPHVQIVGEEGELAPPSPEDALEADTRALLGVDFAVPEALDGELRAEDLVLWIDPLDGTKKFAERKFDEVSVLLGIAYKKRPIAGVMHLPFWGANGVTFWGGPGIGLFKTTHGDSDVHVRQERPPLRYPTRPLVITTSGTRCDLVERALEELKPASVRLGGATGTMVLTVITGESDLFLRFRNATKRWDICAVEPLLEAIGGSLVDKFGRAYEYDPRGDPEFDNGHGLIVTLEAATTKWVLDTMTEIEMLRTLDGTGAMTPAWLTEHAFHGRVSVVTASVVPGSVHRGKQSSVLKLRVEVADAVSGSPRTTSKTLFVKRYVKSELPPRSDAHWRRDLYSYRTESRFYSRFHEKLRAHVALIPPLAVVYATERSADATAAEATDRFLVILESVDSNDDSSDDDASLENTEQFPSLARKRYVHADCLGLSDAREALKYLAQLHAAALTSSGLVREAASELWPSGGWWSFAKRGGMQGLANAPAVWSSVAKAFAPEIDAHFGVDAARRASLQSLAERMMRHAEYISAELFEKSPEALRTLIHGDFKSANLFFDATSRAVVAFDWQWCGVAIGALDVAYLLNTSVSIDALTGGNEELLLRWYYDQFVALLADAPEPSRAVEREYPFEAFRRHYALATLEYARVLLSSFWSGMTPATCAAKFANTNCGLGYRSVPHVLRMIAKLDEGLLMVEHERANAEVK